MHPGRPIVTSRATTPAAPTIERIEEIVAPHGITHVGVASADVLADTRTVLHDRKALGLHDGMQFTYRNPDRSTEPQRAVPDAQSVLVAARPYLTDIDPEPPATGVSARVGRYAWVDHYAELRRGLRVAAAEIEAAGYRALVFADDNSLVDRAIAHRAGLGWFGKNANLLVPGSGSFFVLGSIITTAPYAAQRDAGDRWLRLVRPVPRRLSDHGDHRAGRDRRCPLPELGVAEAGPDPGRVPRGRPRPHLRVRRLPGRVPHLRAPRPAQHRRPRRRRGRGAVPRRRHWSCSTSTMPRSRQRYGRWWIAGREMRWLRRNALIVIGNVADPHDRSVRSTVERYRADDDPILAEHASWAHDRLDQRAATST